MQLEKGVSKLPNRYGSAPIKSAKNVIKAPPPPAAKTTTTKPVKVQRTPKVPRKPRVRPIGWKHPRKMRAIIE